MKVHKLQQHDGVWFAEVLLTQVPAGVHRGPWRHPHEHGTHLIQHVGTYTGPESGSTKTNRVDARCWVKLQDLTPVPLLHVAEWPSGEVFVVVDARTIPEGLPRSPAHATLSVDDFREDFSTEIRQRDVKGPVHVGCLALCWASLHDLPGIEDCNTADDQVLLDRYTGLQREHSKLSVADRDRASAIWSAQLRAKIAASEAETKRRERMQVVCDDQEDI